jgi:glycosyltransferase involved in cell wall biosynthesis
MIFAICFTNFGPYHLARLRALAGRLRRDGDCLIAYEMASTERMYPWQSPRQTEPFDWITFFPNRVLESLTASECAAAIAAALNRDQPDAVGVVGYARPESMAAARWTRRNRHSAILMSESQAIDRPRTWWRERIKRRRLRKFDAALVGGPRHRDYLIDLGMSADRIALGYNAVDNAFYQGRANFWHNHAEGRQGLPASPYFLTVCRFAPEKNLIRLIDAFALYRDQAGPDHSWDLVLCGDGPQAGLIDTAIKRGGHAGSIHRPGFLQADTLTRWYAHAGAFVLPSLSEPWGLVVNEAASSGLPLLVSNRSGCAPTLVPEHLKTTGAQFDPLDTEEMCQKLTWISSLLPAERQTMGLRAAELVSAWGPERFAQGTLEALELAGRSRRTTRPLVPEEKS